MSTLHQNPGPRMDAPLLVVVSQVYSADGRRRVESSRARVRAQILNVAPQAGLSRILPLPSGRKSFPTGKGTRWGWEHLLGLEGAAGQERGIGGRGGAGKGGEPGKKREMGQAGAGGGCRK